jgi:hypothetical protein
LDAFFTRVNGKPFHILDEPTTRQRHQLNQLPSSLSMAIHAVTLRWVTFAHICPFEAIGHLSRCRAMTASHLNGFLEVS